MQYEAATPEEYLNQLENDWRKEKVEELRKLIQSVGDDIEEGISYKMLSYHDSRGIIFHLNAQKNYVSLYIGDAKKIDPDGSLLKGLDVGKGCIRFKKHIILSETRIDSFIAKTIEKWRQGLDISC